MIKLIIFDLDGVLVDAREIHYEALNRALAEIDSKYVITREEHLSTYDGLNTTKKLNLLSSNKSLPKEYHKKVWQLKQDKTIEVVRSFEIDIDKILMLKRLKEEGYTVCVASNSIRHTVKMMLIKRGLLEYIDFFYSNQDVKSPKPSPEIYMKCMIKANVGVLETLIIEDSHIGRKAAINSGAHLCAVKNHEEVTYDKIKSYLNKSSKEDIIKPKWQGGKMNVLIPMAGAGSRFEKAGYSFPKPLIDIGGKPMIQVVTENLNIDARHIYIVQKNHYEKYNLKYLLNLISPDCEIVQVDSVTDGAACTTLLAEKYINNNEPLLIANSDQYIDWDSNEFMYSMVADDIDAGILTFNGTHPKWSFARLNDSGYVCEVAEKKPISNIATVGVYYWKSGSDYVKYAKEMINKDIRTNGEFYVCPVFNEAIKDNKKIKTFMVDRMWGLGTPEDLSKFLEK